MASGTPIVEPQAYDFTRTDPTSSSFWIEQIGNQSPNSDEVSPRYAKRTLYAYTSNDRVSMYAFENRCLGYHYVNSSLELVRIPPQAHPKFPQCYATKISSIQGIKFDGKSEGIPPNWQSAGLQSTADYARNLVAVDFAPPRYAIYPDDADEIYEGITRLEYLRYVEYESKTNVYDVTIPTGRFSFAEGDVGNPKGKAFPGEVNFFEVKTTFSLRWRLVPEDFIMDLENYGLGNPTKIAAAAGHLNATEFMGFPAGTLLLLEPEIERFVSGTLRRSDKIPMYYSDVVLPMVHFDPPLGAGSPFQHGHNNKPWWKSGASDLKYYYTSSNGGTTGIPIYGTYEFANIFTHWSL